MGDHTFAVSTASFTTGLALGVLAVSYRSAWRASLRHWGATPDEADSALAGDELLPHADLVTTRAIAIDAQPQYVWPWLVQMGSGRAGGYSGDWIGNLLGLDLHSASVLLPQFQGIEAGDEFPYGRRGDVMIVEALETERRLVFNLGDGNWIVSFALIPELNLTRLVSRHRIALPRASWLTLPIYALLIELAGALLERRMLTGIRERAQRLASGQDLAGSYPVEVDSYVWSGEHL